MVVKGLRKQLALGNTLGEGVLWHPRQACIWWTDIHACRLYRFHPADDTLTTWQTPERLTAIGFTECDDQLIVSFASGIAFYWPEQNRVEWLAQPEAEIVGNRFNDGRVSPAGHFWAGSIVEQNTGQQAALYRYDGSACHRVITGLRIANGLCWSPDGRTGYYTDSPTRNIIACDHHPVTGELSNPRLFVQTPQGSFPDGACVDTAGNIWSAHFGGGCVVCYSPAGGIVETLALPVSQPTCVAFGGPDLNWLIVTSARENMSAAAIETEPMAGDLFVFDTDTRGLPPTLFAV